ncbi:MAG: TolC family protein [Prevotella sp.]|uniref:TolC family protein n=1 Tax=Prevotella sp. P5-92 TaxID=2024222 RepID=UPI000B95E1A7|nr:TolC family protein [Prevotella sp. P5-92]MCI7398794.1 TolC family protein [Prevotella sp.]MDD6819246.1 TolC family protein [Prevotella sp.]MDY4653464.1 TolC family protein [Prevotella sp.]OYP57237.1 transporter [Prevotella sp. P5-92]
MKSLVFTFALLLSSTAGNAQEKLTLGQCLNIGIENNLSLKIAKGEIVKGKHNISENRSRLLPQINFSASLNDNFDPPVSVTDGTAYGKTYNVTKTLQYNSSAALALQMPLYSQTALTAISIAKTLDQLNQLSYEKAREDLMVQISKMYYLIQNTTEQISIVNDNIRRFKELRDITQAFYDNGMALEIDLKRINVKIETMDVQLANAKAMLSEQYNMLKYVMDYPAEKDIVVEEKVVDKVDDAQLTGLNTNLYELQLLQKKLDMAELQKKMAKDGYLPTLALSANWAYTAYTDKFKNWFHSGESNHWYRSNGIGLQLRVPVFDGFEKRSKIRKAQVDIDNAKLSYENALKSMQTQYANAINDLANNQRNYVKQRDNYRLAEGIYGVTVDRYREGIVSMVEVLQDEMSMSDAQNNYLTAHYNYQVSNLAVLKLTGKLDELFK